MKDLNSFEEFGTLEEVGAETKAIQPKHSKLKSAKLWVTIWAVSMVSFIVLADRTAFTSIAQWLCGVPLAYIGANVWQKQIFEKKS